MQSTHLTSAGGQMLGWSEDETPLEDEQQRHGAPTLCQPLRPESRSAYSVPASVPGVTERLLCASLCAQSHGAPTLCQPLRPEAHILCHLVLTHTWRQGYVSTVG